MMRSTAINWKALLLVMVGLGVLNSIVSLPAAVADQPAQADSRPNIVLIFSDDQGYHDVSCYGSEIPTPHLDSIAKDGMRFTSWYVASSICTPSRFGLLTGTYPSRSQDRLLGPLMSLGPKDAKRGIHSGEITFPALLQKSGYQTALIGKWHLGHGGKQFLPTRHGFGSFVGHTAGCIDYFTMKYGIKRDWYENESLHDESGFATELITEKAIDFLKEQKGEQPFFLFLPYNAPHFGKRYDPKAESTVNILQPRSEELARVQNIKDQKRKEYAAMVLALDDGVGQVLQAIDDLKLRENMRVIFMTDNGADPEFGGSNAPLRGEKATLFEGGIRVPCMARWPGKIPAESVSDAAVGAIDLFPTLCGLGGNDVSDRKLDGQDIRHVLFDAKVKLPKRELFWELHHASALRVGDWKYLRNHGAGKTQEFLFNLADDKDEKTNLAKAEPERFKQLRSRHDVLLAETKAGK